MADQKATDAQLLDAYRRHGGRTTRIAAELGMSTRRVMSRLRALQIAPARPTGGAPKQRPDLPAAAAKEFTVADLPDDDIDVEQLVEHRIRQFSKKAAHADATRAIAVQIKIPGPIGILHFGDPHVDDDGTDLALLRAHSDLTHVEAVFGANVGDTTNNWVGRLAKLYAEQGTSASQAWKLAEWFIGRTRWLYMIGGNHDGWSGAGDPIRWIARQSQALYQPSSARMRLEFPNGRRVIVNARHDFAGHSQYNPSHGTMKALMFGVRDHINVAGHRHVSGYGVLKDPETGRVCHAVQVASYKVLDRYALEKGFRDQRISAAAFTVIDPSLPDTHPDMIKLFWAPEEGAEFLTWLRKRRAEQASEAA
jgi:hypothetical protein